MKLIQHNEYLISTVAIDGLVLQDQSRSSNAADYTPKCFQSFMGQYLVIVVGYSISVIQTAFDYSPLLQWFVKTCMLIHVSWGYAVIFGHNCYIFVKLDKCTYKMYFKTLWPSDAILWHKSQSMMAQEMACCPIAPSLYPIPFLTYH